MVKVTQKRFKPALEQFIRDSGMNRSEASVYLGFADTFCSHTLSAERKSLRASTVTQINLKLQEFYSQRAEQMPLMELNQPHATSATLENMVSVTPLYSKRRQFSLDTYSAVDLAKELGKRVVGFVTGAKYARG